MNEPDSLQKENLALRLFQILARLHPPKDAQESINLLQQCRQAYSLADVIPLERMAWAQKPQDGDTP